MIDLPMLLAFVGAASILALTPGVDTAIVLNTAVTSGKRPALMAAFAIGLGCLAWGAAVSVGLGSMLQASETAYNVVKYLGALYLLLLGLWLLAQPRSSSTADMPAQSHYGSWQAFTRGLIVNLLNPKVGIFYLTFLPQFIPQDKPVALYALLLASIHVLLSMIWFGALIVATVPLGRFLRRPTTIRVLDRLTGGIFVIFAARLAS